MTKPSERIEKKIDTTEFDYRDPCGANNCECYNNSVSINAIISYLDEEYEKRQETTSFTTEKEPKLKKDFEVYNNGWNDCKAEIIKLIMKDYTKYPDCCDYINNLLNKINKI